MKKLLAAMFVALLMVGCGEEAQKKAVQNEAKEEQNRKEKEWKRKEDERKRPKAKWSYSGLDKDGKPDGFVTTRYGNGAKKAEANYKDGKLVSAIIWRPDGEKCPVTNLKDGNGVVVYYNLDGTEDFHITYKNGESQGRD